MFLISIIIPTFNSRHHLEGCIDSIAIQRFKSVEIVIQDGGSTDGTLELIQSLQAKYKDLTIQVTSEPDLGIYDAMNKGLRRARGEWFYFLGSDDRLMSEFTLQKIFGENNVSQYDLLYGKVLFKTQNIEYGHETSFYSMLKEKFNICHQAIFYSRRTFEIVGEYSLLHPVYADYDYNLRCFKNEQIRKHYVNEVIAVFSEDGVSSKGQEIDDFYSGLTSKYVAEFENPVELYLNSIRLIEEIKMLRESKDFKLGTMLLNPMRKIKRIFSR